MIHISEIEICTSTTCLNGGTCQDTPDSYVCNCVDGYTGQQCEDGELLP